MISNIKLIEKREIAKDTMAFYFEKPEGFEYRAGQFADYTLIDPPETDEEGNIRGFSIASAPYEKFIMSATRMRDTAFKRVLKDLPLGTPLKLDAPYGNFTLHKTESIPAVFIIGGIGVTPVRSMIAQASHDKTSHQITLLHANNSPEQAPFASDFTALAHENQNFTFIPIVTDQGAKDWTGKRGCVDQDMLKQCIKDLYTPIYYLSGPQGMVKAMRNLLLSMDVNEDKIKTEEFTGY